MLEAILNKGGHLAGARNIAALAPAALVLCACAPKPDDPVLRVVELCNALAPPVSKDERAALTLSEYVARDEAHRACMARHLERIK